VVRGCRPQPGRGNVTVLWHPAIAAAIDVKGLPPHVLLLCGTSGITRRHVAPVLFRAATAWARSSAGRLREWSFPFPVIQSVREFVYLPMAARFREGDQHARGGIRADIITIWPRTYHGSGLADVRPGDFGGSRRLARDRCAEPLAPDF
jgi:hypothetical protein